MLLNSVPSTRARTSSKMSTIEWASRKCSDRAWYRSSGGFSDPQGGSSNSATEAAAAAEVVHRKRAMSEAIEDACQSHAELVEPASSLHAAAILLMGDVSPNTGVRASCASDSDIALGMQQQTLPLH